MSFAGEVRTELCRTESRPCCWAAECCGALLYGTEYTPNRIRVITGHALFAERLTRLMTEAFSVRPALTAPTEEGGKYTVTLTDRAQIARVTEALGCGGPSLHVNLGLLEESCCRAAFLRGAFLAGGSVTDPAGRIHWELSTPHRGVSRETVALLQDLGYNPGIAERAGNRVLYFKQSEAAEELLTRMGAPVCAMRVMTERVEKEVANRVNRRVNCDLANVDRTLNAATRQEKAIRSLTPLLPGLPRVLREAAQLRMDHPEASLGELAALADPPVSKSAMNHRLRRLAALASEAKASPETDADA